MGGREILFVPILKASNGFPFRRMPAQDSLRRSVLSFELALAVQWLCGALSSPGLAPVTLNPI